ncbi:MAG: hypothetical protein JO257_04860 [Deltaproteobacteria bacterium]|nr:hypothetical protein [Deltaproteobacteria bacterium]
MRRLLGVALVLAGCLKPSSTTCSEGWTCPNGLACAPAGVFCAAKADLDACAASTVDAHDACSTADVGSGVCIGKVCRACETDYEGCKVSTWTPMGYSGEALKGVWRTDRRTAVAAGVMGTIARYDGTGWTTVSVGSHDYAGVAVADRTYALYSTDVEAVTTTATVAHVAPNNVTYRGIWAAGSDAFAVGPLGTVSHEAGGAWTDMAIGSGAPNLYGIGGSSGSDVWAVGTAGTVWHSTGGAFSQSTSAVLSGTLRAVWSSSPGDVFVVGSPSLMFHFDGAAWTPMTLPTANLAMLGVWGTSASDVWAVGNDGGGVGQILHYDGTSWSVAASGQPALYGIMGVGSDVLAVGNGVVLRYSP